MKHPSKPAEAKWDADLARPRPLFWHFCLSAVCSFRQNNESDFISRFYDASQCKFRPDRSCADAQMLTAQTP